MSEDTQNPISRFFTEADREEMIEALKKVDQRILELALHYQSPMREHGWLELRNLAARIVGYNEKQEL